MINAINEPNNKKKKKLTQETRPTEVRFKYPIRNTNRYSGNSDDSGYSIDDTSEETESKESTEEEDEISDYEENDKTIQEVETRSQIGKFLDTHTPQRTSLSRTASSQGSESSLAFEQLIEALNQQKKLLPPQDVGIKRERSVSGQQHIDMKSPETKRISRDNTPANYSKELPDVMESHQDEIEVERQLVKPKVSTEVAEGSKQHRQYKAQRALGQGRSSGQSNTTHLKSLIISRAWIPPTKTEQQDKALREKLSKYSSIAQKYAQEKATL